MSAAEAIIPWVTGPISVISSITIVITVLRSNRALSRSMHRIMFGLCISDIIASIAMSAGSLPAPKNTEHLGNNFGNQSTCDAQGFMFLAGSIAEQLYQCSLQMYILILLKYGMRPDDMQRKIEPFLHGIPILYGIAGAAVSLVTESINASGAWCYIESYPHGCRDDEDIECTRGTRVILKRMVFSTIPIVFSYIMMSIAGINICQLVQNTEIATNPMYCRRAQRPILQVNEDPQLTRVTGRMAFERIAQFHAAFLLANFFPFLANFILAFGERINILFIIQSILFPLQGFFNLLVFTNLTYKRVSLSSSEDLSILKAFAIAIISYGIWETKDDHPSEENQVDYSQDIELVRDQMEFWRNTNATSQIEMDIIGEEEVIDEGVPIDDFKTNQIVEEINMNKEKHLNSSRHIELVRE